MVMNNRLCAECKRFHNHYDPGPGQYRPLDWPDVCIWCEELYFCLERKW